MKNNIQEEVVTINGINLIAEFQIHGKYMPATRIDPAEYPELELLSVKVVYSDVDIFDLLSNKQIEEVKTQIKENYEN